MAARRTDSASAHEMLARARRDVSLARGAESFFLGVTAMLIAVCAAVHAGAALDDVGAWLAGLLAGYFAGASWWVERRPDITRLARKVDKRLRLGGSLVTAFECESAGDDSLVAQLLGERVRRNVSVMDVVRAALPNSIPFLAPPFAAAALLAATLDEPPTDRSWVAPRTLALMTEMENVRESVLDSIEAGELDADLLQQALALETQARALARKSASADGEAEDLREDLESLDRSLTDLALQMPPGSAAREAVRDAEALADGALSGLDPTKSGDPESGPDSSDSGRQDPDAGTSKPDPAGTGQGDLGENGANALANGATDGRISAPPSPVDANPAEGGAATRAASDRAHGVAAGRWWPESYAGVVERWAQARRSARTEPTSERD